MQIATQFELMTNRTHILYFCFVFQVPRNPIFVVHDERKTKNCSQVARVCETEFYKYKQFINLLTQLFKIERRNNGRLCEASSILQGHGEVSRQIDHLVRCRQQAAREFRRFVALLAAAGDSSRALVSHV